MLYMICNPCQLWTIPSTGSSSENVAIPNSDTQRATELKCQSVCVCVFANTTQQASGLKFDVPRLYQIIGLCKHLDKIREPEVYLSVFTIFSREIRE